MIGQRRLIAAELGVLDGRRVAVILLSFAPAAAAGLGFERQIEGRLGGPRGMAGGLIGGAIAMVAADRMPQSRAAGEATALDGLALGFAQASALAPGVSRNGATLAAARLRRFGREDSNLLSRTVALPVIAGATALKGERLRRRGIPPGLGRRLAAGTLAAFCSTLASQGLIRLIERDRALWPYASYRLALAGLVLAKLRASRTSRG